MTAPITPPVKKLSPTQQRVMKWLGQGWTAYPAGGSALRVNGDRICNVDTMTVLERMGLVRKDKDNCWDATPSGKVFTTQMLG